MNLDGVRCVDRVLYGRVIRAVESLEQHRRVMAVDANNMLVILRMILLENKKGAVSLNSLLVSRKACSVAIQYHNKWPEAMEGEVA